MYINTHKPKASAAPLKSVIKFKAGICHRDSYNVFNGGSDPEELVLCLSVSFSGKHFWFTEIGIKLVTEMKETSRHPV